MGDKSDFVWEQYKHEVDLHREYIELVIKLNVFNYAVTGAIVSFYFAEAEAPLIYWSLVLPVIMNLGLAFFFFGGARSAKVSQENILSLSNALNFEIHSVVAHILGRLLWIFFGTSLITGLGLGVLFLRGLNLVVTIG